MRAKYGKSETYTSIHQWLKWNFGHGEKCERCGLIGKKTARKWNIEWALKPGLEYKKIREHFEALCRSCHRKQDLNEEMLANFRKGWIERREKFGLNKIDPKTGRFIKNK